MGFYTFNRHHSLQIKTGEYRYIAENSPGYKLILTLISRIHCREDGSLLIVKVRCYYNGKHGFTPRAEKCDAGVCGICNANRNQGFVFGA